MSRGQTPRTPRYFPKMKLRGAKNKYLGSLRNQTVSTMRVNVTSVREDGSVDFVVDANGTHMLTARSKITDGFGRVYPEPPKPKPKPAPKAGGWSFSTQFSTEGPVSEELMDLITGGSSR